MPNFAERNPSMFAHGFVFLIVLSVASSSLLEENMPTPDVKIASVPIKNNFKTAMVIRFVVI
jgi:hypothetical protein